MKSFPFLDILKMTINIFTRTITPTLKEEIIGFYLRALRICSPKYLDDEFNYQEIPF